MFEPLRQFFSANGFMPHGHCYLWNPILLWLEVVSNSLIGLAYVAISVTLAYLVYRIRDLPFQWMYLAFGLFIVTCGFTHFLDVITVWVPVYWIDGAIRVITAIASVGTASLLPSLVPKGVALAQGAKIALDRGIKLETANRELSTLFERAKELDELKTQFFANVSHELRTPLALILGPVEKLRTTSNLTEEQRRELEVVSRNARTLLKHVNDLLDIAKLEAGKMIPRYVETDLIKLVRFISSNFEGVANERNISFILNLPQMMNVQIDSDMIQQVIVNLLSNAFKFTPGGGSVTVTLEKKAERVNLSVQDTGPGVPPEMRNAIFERFRQVDGGATRRFGGTGLGLSIVKEFTELHRGWTAVIDAPGGGALFTVSLPILAPSGISVRSALEQERVSEGLVRPAAESLRDLNRQLGEIAVDQGLEKGRVLVVEDNVDMNRFIADALSAEFRVVIAYDGKEGLDKLASSHPDLVLTDIMMPGMSGEQMVAEIRKRPELSGLPIMVLTAKADDELRVRLLREGAQDYVIKPFSSEEVLARVRNLVAIKRARETLQRELSSQIQDLEVLAKEVTLRRRELQQTAERLHVAKQEAERLSQVKSTFLGLVSHEMKTPLTSLQLQLELLRRVDAERLTVRQVELINRVSKSSQRSLNLMNSLLEFVKLQGGRVEPKVEVFDLYGAVSELTDSFQDEAQEKHLELILLRPETDFPEFKGDRLIVQVVVRNLIDNAIKYTEQGSVRVLCAHREGRFYISVQDTGRGITEEQQALLFEPFEQLTPLLKKHQPGFGLGLAIARETITALGGKIEWVSKVGEGSTFTAMFPSMIIQGEEDLSAKIKSAS